MAQKTALQIYGVPGRLQSFSPKIEAVIPKGDGPFTALRVYALPGQRQAFIAKTAAEAVAGKRIYRFWMRGHPTGFPR